MFFNYYYYYQDLNLYKKILSYNWHSYMNLKELYLLIILLIHYYKTWALIIINVIDTIFYKKINLEWSSTIILKY